VQVYRPEMRAHHVPVRLLGAQVQVGQLDERVLQVRADGGDVDVDEPVRLGRLDQVAVLGRDGLLLPWHGSPFAWTVLI
jgi:hypothetical protein